MSKIVLTTGGTGGHIYPALAVAEKLKEEGHEVIFIGTCNRMEKDIIPSTGYKFYGLDIVPIKSVNGIIKLTKGIFEAIKILKNEKIDSVIGFGNYISLPALIAAKFLRKPIYLQEQNVSMGQANKLMYPYAKNVFLAFPETLKFIEKKYKDKFVVTGNPIRKEFYEITKEEARKKLEIDEKKKVVCIMGGSLGAKSINDAVVKNFSLFDNEDILLYWACGKDLYKEYISKVREKENTIIVPYFENSYNIMAASDLILCRAGASTISEIIELEKPSILIPYDFVGQKENAEILDVIDAGKVFTNETANQAIEEIIKLISDNDRLKFMEENIEKIKPSNAVISIVKYFGEDNK